MQKGVVLPSSGFRIIQDGDHYKDMYPTQPLKYSEDDTHIGTPFYKQIPDYSTKYQDINLELKLNLAEGIPIPDETTIKRENLIKREVYVTFYKENAAYPYVSNICRV